MSYTLKVELSVNKETDELFLKVTVSDLKGQDLKLGPIYNPYDSKAETEIKDHTIVNCQLVKRVSDCTTITLENESIPWEGLNGSTIDKTDHTVTVILRDENNVYCTEVSENSSNAKDAQPEVG